MATVSLQVQSRDSFGKGVARKIRQAGSVPAVVYRDGSEPAHVSLDPQALELAFARTGNRNTLVDIQVEGGGSHLCLVKDVQRHPLSQAIQHVDFFEVRADEEISVLVPIRLVGKAQGVAMGGKLRIIARDIQLRCKPGDIPATVDVDVSHLEIGKFISASELTAPEGCTLQFVQDFNVATVMARRGAVAEEAEEAAAAPAAPAEAEA